MKSTNGVCYIVSETRSRRVWINDYPTEKARKQAITNFFNENGEDTFSTSATYHLANPNKFKEKN
jgi:hypothetical protein